MLAQQQPKDARRPVARTPFRLVAGRSVQAVPASPAIPTAIHGDVRRDQPIIGHRLAGGYMSVHAPGQPCGLCSGAGPLPPRPYREEHAAIWRRPA